MKSTAFALCAMLLIRPAAASGPTESTDNSEYKFCNVFLADACFGIVAGDFLTAQVVIDFMLYDIRFASGGTARIYSGYHPAMQSSAERFTNCGWEHQFSQCKYRELSDGRTEYLARRTERSAAVHVLTDDRVSPSTISSFLKNVKPCVSTREVTHTKCGEARVATSEPPTR